MITNLARAIEQLRDRGSVRLVALSVSLAFGVLVILTIASQVLLDAFADTGFVWLDWIVQIVGLGGAIVLAWLLFPILISTTIGAFLDRVIDAVEAKNYPYLPPPRPQPIREVILGAVRFGLVALAVNLLVLPLYLVPGANLPIFIVLNGYLLGREYFEQIAARRVPTVEVAALRRANRNRCWIAGIVLALLLLIPFVNLVAPIIGIAFMTHNIHTWKLIVSDAVPTNASD